jgi:hypothetical protein
MKMGKGKREKKTKRDSWLNGPGGFWPSRARAPHGQPTQLGPPTGHGGCGDDAVSAGPRASEGRRETTLGREKQWFTEEKGPAVDGFDGGSPPVARFSAIG